MNWYKKAQSNLGFSTWLADELKRITDNYQYKPSTTMAPTPEVFQQNIQDIQTWATETNPDLSKHDIHSALIEAQQYKTNKKYMSESEKTEANRKGFLSEHQNINPQAPNFAVDITGKQKAIPPTIKNRINKAIHKATSNKWFDAIPLDEIMNACETNDVVILQEDGKKWSGFLMGNAECGTEDTRNQTTIFQVAHKQEDGNYVITKNGVYLSWCAIGNGKLEIVCYIG